MRIFLWWSNSWISRKSFPTWLSRIVTAEWRNPCAVISPTPRALQAARSRKLNARLQNGSPEYPANTNWEAAKAIPPEQTAALIFCWRAFHSRSAALKRTGTGTSWKTLPLPLEAYRFLGDGKNAASLKQIRVALSSAYKH